MTQDWTVVGRAIDERMSELELTATKLGRRASVSKSTIYELRYGIIRRRAGRTLKAVSKALGWHESHLHALLDGRTPQHPDEPAVDHDKDVDGKLDLLIHQMAAAHTKLDALAASDR
ncbi:hypothetical protein [Actinokineospora enzanensis]|uniref:hypothetical protein n=1 Tax=Actinokineospora enzanensis TaxID=155975 RepID=UPI00039E2823|nr:hypothetical protein [Actinokineospora enzanensis]